MNADSIEGERSSERSDGCRLRFLQSGSQRIVDWGSQKHQACLLDTAGAGEVLGEREFEHGGAGLSEMADWLLSFTVGNAVNVGVAIETPSGTVVESLLEHGYAVHSINPKQLDRFRDRLSPGGRKTSGGMRRCWPRRCVPTRTVCDGSRRPTRRSSSYASGRA